MQIIYRPLVWKSIDYLLCGQALLCRIQRVGTWRPVWPVQGLFKAGVEKSFAISYKKPVRRDTEVCTAAGGGGIPFEKDDALTCSRHLKHVKYLIRRIRSIRSIRSIIQIVPEVTLGTLLRRIQSQSLSRSGLMREIYLNSSQFTLKTSMRNWIVSHFALEIGEMDVSKSFKRVSDYSGGAPL